jgi:hypothetical protein
LRQAPPAGAGKVLNGALETLRQLVNETYNVKKEE